MNLHKVIMSVAFSGVAIAPWLLVGACAAHDGTDEQPAVSAQGSYLTMPRPATVPAHFVPTPNGWFDPGCVQTIAEHEKLLSDGRIARADGSIRREATQCPSPRFDAKGNVVVERPGGADAQGAGSKNPTVNGWIEDVDSTALGALSYLRAAWTVPFNPSNTGQVIYFFPGLVDSPSTRILQPVLGWNHADGPGGQWSMASWNCCVNGTTFHGPFVSATAGTTVSGDMTGTNCDANGVCSNWSIVSYNDLGQGVALATTVSTAMVWMFGHALEAYSIDTCNELAGGTSSTASGFVARKADGTSAAIPAWNHTFWGASPSCNYQITDTGSTATLLWNVVPPQCSPGATRTCCPWGGGQCGCLGLQTCGGDSQWGGCEGAIKKPGECR